MKFHNRKHLLDHRNSARITVSKDRIVEVSSKDHTVVVASSEAAIVALGSNMATKADFILTENSNVCKSEIRVQQLVIKDRTTSMR